MSVFQHNAVTFNTDELGDTVFHQVNVGIVYISKEKKDRCIWHRNTSKVELEVFATGQSSQGYWCIQDT